MLSKRVGKFTASISAKQKGYDLTTCLLIAWSKIDSRYHLRAYSHDYDVWGDYVLSRFADADILSDAIIPADQDKDWNTSVELRFQLNPALDEATKSTIRWEWYLKESEAFVTITTRKALQNYAVRQMTRPDYQALKPLFIFQE